MLDRELKLHALTLDYARKLLVDIDDADFAVQIAPGVNCPAWIVGHLAVVADLGARLLGGDNLLGKDWMEKYGPGSTPSGDRAHYPPKADLIAVFEEASARMRTAAESVDENRLEARQRTGFFKEELPTLGDFLAHLMTTHSMLHLGQLSTWRRIRGHGSALGI